MKSVNNEGTLELADIVEEATLALTRRVRYLSDLVDDMETLLSQHVPDVGAAIAAFRIVNPTDNPDPT